MPCVAPKSEGQALACFQLLLLAAGSAKQSELTARIEQIVRAYTTTTTTAFILTATANSIFKSQKDCGRASPAGQMSNSQAAYSATSNRNSQEPTKLSPAHRLPRGIQDPIRLTRQSSSLTTQRAQNTLQTKTGDQYREGPADKVLATIEEYTPAKRITKQQPYTST